MGILQTSMRSSGGSMGKSWISISGGVIGSLLPEERNTRDSEWIEMHLEIDVRRESGHEVSSALWKWMMIAAVCVLYRVVTCSFRIRRKEEPAIWISLFWICYQYVARDRSPCSNLFESQSPPFATSLKSLITWWNCAKARNSPTVPWPKIGVFNELTYLRYYVDPFQCYVNLSNNFEIIPRCLQFDFRSKVMELLEDLLLPVAYKFSSFTLGIFPLEINLLESIRLAPLRTIAESLTQCLVFWKPSTVSWCSSVEVREMIWELALPAGRRHRIWPSQHLRYQSPN